MPLPGATKRDTLGAPKEARLPICPECEAPVERTFRYCPWCAAPQRMKLVEFFHAHPTVDSGRGRALRVSRYFGSEPDERHVRFSVWNETGEAEAAVSLDDGEADRMARFVLEAGTPPASRQRFLDSMLAQLRGR